MLDELTSGQVDKWLVDEETNFINSFQSCKHWKEFYKRELPSNPFQEGIYEISFGLVNKLNPLFQQIIAPHKNNFKKTWN